MPNRVTKSGTTALIAIALSFSLSSCQTMDGIGQLGGAVLGGAGGAYAGQLFGQGKGRLLATAGGTLLGAISGGFLGDRLIDRPVRNSRQIELLGQRQPVVTILPTPSPGYQPAPSNLSLPLSPANCKLVNNHLICGQK